MNSRSEQKKATKDKILQAARELFAIYGISNCSTAEIARKAKVSHGTIFAHFKTRDDLLVKLIFDSFKIIAERMKSDPSRDSSLKESLHIHLNGIKENESFYTEIIREKHLLPEEAQSAILLAQSTIASMLIREIEKSIQQQTTKQLEPVFIINAWFALIHHYLLDSKSFVPGGSMIETKGTEIVQNFLEMIKR